MTFADIRTAGVARIDRLVPRVIIDLVAYAAVSAVALGVDCGLLYWLVRDGVYYLGASTISFTIGMMVAYVLSSRFVFSDRRAESRWAEACGFVAVGLAGLALTQILLYASVTGLGLPIAVAKAATVTVVFLFNFLGRRHLVFKGADGR